MCSFVKYEIFPYNRTEMSAERRRALPTTAEFLTFEKQRDPSNAESVFVLTPTRMDVSWNFRVLGLLIKSKRVKTNVVFNQTHYAPTIKAEIWFNFT